MRVAVSLDAEKAVLAGHGLPPHREPQQVADGVPQAREGDEDERALGVEVVRGGASSPAAVRMSTRARSDQGCMVGVHGTRE